MEEVKKKSKLKEALGSGTKFEKEGAIHCQDLQLPAACDTGNAHFHEMVRMEIGVQGTEIVSDACQQCMVLPLIFCKRRQLQSTAGPRITISSPPNLALALAVSLHSAGTAIARTQTPVTQHCDFLPASQAPPCSLASARHKGLVPPVQRPRSPSKIDHKSLTRLG